MSQKQGRKSRGFDQGIDIIFYLKIEFANWAIKIENKVLINFRLN